MLSPKACIPLVVSEEMEIHLELPPTESNFLGYNKVCSALDSDFLMQPVNEAQYDSETQACVDRNTGGPESFYDHYQPRPTKKKGLSVGCESPLSYVPPPPPQFSSKDALQVPSEREVPSAAVTRDVLKDPVTRRLATGRMPPPSE